MSELFIFRVGEGRWVTVHGQVGVYSELTIYIQGVQSGVGVQFMDNYVTVTQMLYCVNIK